jgi:hypothetical protein
VCILRVTDTSAGILGDVNGDGNLTEADCDLLVWLLKRKTRDPTPAELAAGDMNGNGRLDHADAPLLLRLINGKPLNP